MIENANRLFRRLNRLWLPPLPGSSLSRSALVVATELSADLAQLEFDFARHSAEIASKLDRLRQQLEEIATTSTATDEAAARPARRMRAPKPAVLVSEQVIRQREKLWLRYLSLKI